MSQMSQFCVRLDTKVAGPAKAVLEECLKEVTNVTGAELSEDRKLLTISFSSGRPLAEEELKLRSISRFILLNLGFLRDTSVIGQPEILK